MYVSFYCKQKGKYLRSIIHIISIKSKTKKYAVVKKLNRRVDVQNQSLVSQAAAAAVQAAAPLVQVQVPVPVLRAVAAAVNHHRVNLANQMNAVVMARKQ